MQRETPAEWAARAREARQKWGDLVSGTPVGIVGTPHDGLTGVVISWQVNWGAPRAGCVPVHLPKFKHSYFFWFSPQQLKPVL